MDEILAAVRRVPLLSVQAGQLLKVTGDPRHAPRDVLRIIETDAILTAQVLRVVNSAAFGRPAAVTSVERALALVGESLVVGIALSKAADSVFASPLTGYQGQRGDLWRHDLFTALAARSLASHTTEAVDPDLAFTAGLLHDIGKAVLSDFLTAAGPEVLAGLAALSGQPAPDFCALEAAATGVSHSAVGQDLAGHWQLPEPLPSVIGGHHRPAAAAPGIRTLAYTVHLADQLAMMAGIGTGADSLHYPLDPEYPRHVRLSAQELSQLFLAIQEEYRAIAASLRPGQGDLP
ncbi:MAG: HDOD domain-containing protein [Thermodesulfobacteriota bacterium]